MAKKLANIVKKSIGKISMPRQIGLVDNVSILSDSGKIDKFTPIPIFK